MTELSPLRRRKMPIREQSGPNPDFAWFQLAETAIRNILRLIAKLRPPAIAPFRMA